MRLDRNATVSLCLALDISPDDVAWVEGSTGADGRRKYTVVFKPKFPTDLVIEVVPHEEG